MLDGVREFRRRRRVICWPFAALAVLLMLAAGVGSEYSVFVRRPVLFFLGYDGCTCRDCVAGGVAPFASYVNSPDSYWYNKAVVLLAIMSALLWVSPTLLVMEAQAAWRRRVKNTTTCGACGYPREGLTGGVCPECGGELDVKGPLSAGRGRPRPRR